MILKSLIFLLFSLVTMAGFTQNDTAYIFTYGGDRDEQGRDIQMTRDSGFIMVGATSSFGYGNSDVYLVKVDSALTYQWSKAIGHQHTEFGHAVKQTSDDGYFVCGMTNSLGNGNYDMYVLRLNHRGEIVWEKTFGGFDWDIAHDLELTDDGGCIVVGETHSLGNGDADAYLIRLDKDGNLLWEKTMGGKQKDIAYGIIRTKDGNYAFCGENASKNDTSGSDAWFVRIDVNGTILLDTTYSKPYDDYLYSLIERMNGEFAFIGKSYSWNYPFSDIFLLGLSSTGEFIWDFNHGLIGNAAGLDNDEGRDIKEYPNGNLLIVGSSLLGNGGYSIYTGMTGPQGQYITAPSYGLGGEDFGYGVAFHPKKGELFLGTSNEPTNGYSDLVLVQVDTVDGGKFHVISNFRDNLTETPSGVGYESSPGFTIMPNPSSGKFFLEFNKAEDRKIEVINNSGSLLIQQESNLESVEINLNSYPPGIYHLSVIETSGRGHFRLIKQ